MAEEINALPPRPFPYPNNPAFRKLLRFPIVLYRLGLGKLIGKYIMIVSTFGRKSGKVRRTPIEFYRIGEDVYAISGFEHDPDWYLNLKANPYTTLQISQKSLHMLARRPETDEEWEGVIEYIKKSPIPKVFVPEVVIHVEDPQVQKQIRDWPVVVFKPTTEPCPADLEIDLLWTWPLILILMAVKITFWWLIRRRK